MISLPQAVGDDPTPETRNLRSRPRVSTSDQSHVTVQRTPNDEASRVEVLESEQPAKRLKTSQEISIEPTKAVATSISTPVATSTEAKPNPRVSSTPLSLKEPGDGKRRTWTLQKTKRASSLNLHNHPVISHPVGIAIWLLQKIDQARKSNSSDDERSPSTSMPTSPGGVRPSTEIGTFCARIDRSESATAFSNKAPTLTGAQPLWGQSNVNEHEDDTARRQAQRHRKTKQRSENWAKNKENDVVARAKLEAKKKYGVHPQQEMLRKKFVDERVRDDYGRLLGRQTAQFADAMAQLAPFRVGHSDDFVKSSLPRFELHHPYVQAGKLLLDVLPALAEPHVSERSQSAADALLAALELGNPDETSFFSFIEVLSDDEVIQRGIDKVLGQLLNARPEERRASRSQASPAGGQLAPPTAATSPDSTGLSLKRLTWKEPATLKDNNFTPPNNFVPSPETQPPQPPGLPPKSSTPPNAPQNLPPLPSQTGSMPSPSPSADLTPSTIMPPPPPAQARCSGRERKPTAKVLAAGTETPSRPSTASPSTTSRPTLARNARSTPRVPSKLSLSELIVDREETPSTPTAPTTVLPQHTLPEAISSASTTSPTTTAAIDRPALPPTSDGPLIPLIVPRSLQQPHPTTTPRLDLQRGLDPQLTANLLQLADIAANMSDSDDDDELEMEEKDVPSHERLIRILQAQSSSAKWHISTPNSVEQSGKISNAGPSQTVPANVSAVQPTPLPPVNTIISTKAAQVASSFFKSLAAGEPLTNTPEPEHTPSERMNPYTGAERNAIPAPSVHGSKVMTNGTTSAGQSNAAGSRVPFTQPPGPEAQNMHPGNNVLHGNANLGGTNTNVQGALLPRLSRPEVQAAIARHATSSPQRALVPLDRKRKFEDEGYDIAMSRLRSHAESRGLAPDPELTYEQLNAMIDEHDKVARYTHNRTNRTSMPPGSTRSYTNGLAANGNTAYGLTGPSPTTMERPLSSDGLRRLAPNSAWPVHHHHPPYNGLPPRSPAAHYHPLPNSFPYPDAQRPPNGLVINTYSKNFQFVPPKQPSQFSNQSSPVTEKAPSSTNGDDPRKQHQNALNGGPPGGGAVINSRTNKKQQTTNAASFKFLVNAKESPITQSQPKRGGQLMTFT